MSRSRFVRPVFRRNCVMRIQFAGVIWSQDRIDGRNDRNDPRMFSPAEPTAERPRLDIALCGGTNIEILIDVVFIDRTVVDSVSRRYRSPSFTRRSGSGAA